ncbi:MULTISPECIES: XrtA/PEP-CTERM system-associated ATPase [Rhodanobacter]|uniref:Putative secretion ATPase, PEP-CTERM locus subfamily n=1 Tax=Rhodanobacter denitrificans TaxID=666685 RepID=M4NGY0_9GAMM|nr:MULTISPECIES: XrtA/PEP-CTERM system-associated ATPase [Rhodanobacter]AGG90154.1 putative secretion ATPase, PEP-CTERM locus subfamily [Rhodanobacter denitrificans]KZC21289.1 ATPase [Rhodanobacter denitrificans]UJJ50251.1 XrtA-associated ATPase [Rhodanobacter denitrificans]UJM85542.1 XrtA-associated ATPase [Rhodanobacter denitrificans]UJM92966.1 XrtA-associated ATPase [Rhodanobacter denitrificans]
MYQAFYKLRGKPFQLTPDPGMLFPSKGHKRAMAYLLYGFEQGEGFVVITGAVGTGKTLLIQKLFEELSHRNLAVASIASANLDGDDILPAVASALDLPYDGRSKEALLQDVKRHLISLHARQAHALLVVDEAQTLTAAALEMLRILSNLEFKGRALLQIFLVGQTELRRVMVSNHMEQLRQRIIASHRLEPMSEEESRAYILHRLHTVGWSNDPDLAPEIFTGVYRASRGIPRKINLIMDRLLLHGYLEELHDLDQAALTVVLDEIRDEMPGVPPTLEVSAALQDLDLTRDAASSQRDGGLASMDLERSKFMLQLLREEVRRREVLLAASSMAPAVDEAVITDMRYPRSSQEGK